MTDQPTSEMRDKLRDAVVAWALKLEKVRGLKRQRASFQCENYEPSVNGPDGYFERGVPACRHHDPFDARVEWCEPCKQRELVLAEIPPAKHAERQARELVYRRALAAVAGRL